ncbi:cation efflux family-domain-containing protein [Tricharina praecox]|uniref:cation efflux family-domain-containing protein n=1 Tax=Tricharina praecox TaxID=43433 RepID=UPI00221F9456|nr:cation efflux family-domain-containing protein [Tricharina praecox]KAI5843703.1 cation efflux family-domain-containing protein [Tricharina praecox]
MASPLLSSRAPETPQIIPPTPTGMTTTGLGIDSETMSLATAFPAFHAAAVAPAEKQASAGPFNFQPMVASKSPIIPKPNQRRGHKYKHSSVSHQIFLEPPVRAPLTLPASLPMPTWKELYRSVSSEQRRRALWCIAHLGVAAFTLYSAAGSLALTALSHLIMFDALGATVCAAVDVLSNFDVWKRSSIRHPFGLERAEVLAGFAMSVFLLFMGFDIISHGAEHLLEGWWLEEGEGHVHEEHVARVTAGSIDVAALAALAATTVSALLLKNHARIGRAMHIAALSHLPSILSNPSHLLTLATSTLLLLIPLLSLPQSSYLDRALALTMALSMIAIGARLVRVLGSMLLMSHSRGADVVPKVVDEISKDLAVREVQEARFWQAHHGLCIATLKVVMEAGMEEGRLRERVGRLVRERLGGVYGSTKGQGARWEVSVAVTTL